MGAVIARSSYVRYIKLKSWLNNEGLCRWTTDATVTTKYIILSEIPHSIPIFHHFPTYLPDQNIQAKILQLCDIYQIIYQIILALI